MFRKEQSKWFENGQTYCSCHAPHWTRVWSWLKVHEEMRSWHTNMLPFYRGTRAFMEFGSLWNQSLEIVRGDCVQGHLSESESCHGFRVLFLCVSLCLWRHPPLTCGCLLEHPGVLPWRTHLTPQLFGSCILLLHLSVVCSSWNAF